MLSSSTARSRDCCLAHPQVQFQRFGELAADRQHGVEAGHRVLEHHGDLRAPDVTNLLPRHLEEILALEDRLPAGNLARRFWNETHQREHADTLAAAALADDSQRLSFCEFVTDAVDGVD